MDWRRSFGEWFLIGLAFAVATALLEPLRRLVLSTRDPRSIVQRQRYTNVVGSLSLLALISLTIFGHGSGLSVLLGLAAAAACAFIASTVYWLTRSPAA